jgi:hypothetical protein
MRYALGGLAILAAISSAAHADCNPTGRIDAQCYPDLQSATAAAIAANQPLWLPAGTYTLAQELVIDYAALADTGFQIISDGAVIDATATGQRAITVTCSGGTPASPKSCFYLHIQGTLFVNANTWEAAVWFGQNDFSDAHNSAKIDHLIVNNAGTGFGTRLNYVLNADLSLYSVTAGSAGMDLRPRKVAKPRGRSSRNSAACAASAATRISGFVAPGRPKPIFSRASAPKITGSCGTNPMRLRTSAGSAERRSTPSIRTAPCCGS